MEIRLLDENDLPDILRIEIASFPSPWSEALFRNELDNPSSTIYGLFNGGKLCGYSVGSTVLDELHILTIAVANENRRQGVGESLLRHNLDSAKKQGVVTVFLEVRAGNIPARALYEKLGFRYVGGRRGYYSNNGEDAALYTLTLDGVCGGHSR